MRRSRALAAGAALVLLLMAAGVSADAVTGTFTGSVSLRGNYFWERSTRVVAPAFSATLDSPHGVRADASYLIDAITSASLAAGPAEDVAFREIRHDVQGGLGHEFDFGTAQLDLSARVRFSKEPDYLSRGVGFSSALSLAQRSHVLRLNGYYLDDGVYRADRSTNTRTFVGDLETLSLGFAWDALLTSLATLTVGYDLARLEGFTANAYRYVAFRDGAPKSEHHPDLRLRHAVYAWLSHYVPATRTALRAGYRVYRDDWEITAHAPEFRIYQEFGPYFELRLRYRYYTQTPSFFWHKGRGPSAEPYPTADPKMSPFQDQTLGGKLRLALGFLRRTPLRVFESAVLDLSVEYMFSTSRYGNALIGQGGLLWPF